MLRDYLTLPTVYLRRYCRISHLPLPLPPPRLRYVVYLFMQHTVISTWFPTVLPARISYHTQGRTYNRRQNAFASFTSPAMTLELVPRQGREERGWGVRKGGYRGTGNELILKHHGTGYQPEQRTRGS